MAAGFSSRCHAPQRPFLETYGETYGFYTKAAIKIFTEVRVWEVFGVGVEGFVPSRNMYRPERGTFDMDGSSRHGLDYTSIGTGAFK